MSSSGSSAWALGMGGSSRGVRDKVVALVGELRDTVGFELNLSFDGAVDTAVSENIAEHLIAAIREAVTNIERHAKATKATVELSARDGHRQLVVADNGQGLNRKGREGGLGLTNLRRRAEKLHGEFDVVSAPTGGTILTWRVPVSE
jgi:signal transduction histidine kinase